MATESTFRIFRFGSFEANEETGELRKHGIRIKLHGQPFRVLVMLLERPSELVTREEMRQHLWDNDTFVDFDHGLNSAVNKLREALGDSASQPRHVETVAGRGYRFIAPVTFALPLDRSESVAAAESTPLAAEINPWDILRRATAFASCAHGGAGDDGRHADTSAPLPARSPSV
jgi:DNA-binding winged helix-turn-helix (wHTH) protein